MAMFLKSNNTTVHIQPLKKAQEVVMLQLPFMVLMIVPRFGHCVVSVTSHSPKLGMAELLSVLTTLSAPPLLSGLDILSGSRKCGKASSTAWLPI